MDISIFKDWNDSGNDVLYPIDEINLYGLKVFIGNCTRMGNLDNSNVSVATGDPHSWLPEFIDKIFFKFSYVTPTPTFLTYKLIGDKVTVVSYASDILEVGSIDDILDMIKFDEFKTLVLFSATKYVDLDTLTVKYIIKYADISDKSTTRDKKLSKIINGTNNNLHL